MQIPYEVQARPDTGLYNAKLGIWLFLASEVMLFGGLFSAYVFLRLGAEPGFWPKGLLNVPIGTMNTVVLIGSSVTVVLAWASLKMRRFVAYKRWMLATIVCGFLFLFVKLAFEWPPKFNHFGAYINKAKWSKYESALGNEHLAKLKLPPRVEITGHLHGLEVNVADADPEALKEVLEDYDLKSKSISQSGHELLIQGHDEHHGMKVSAAEALARVRGVVTNPDEKDPKKQVRKIPGVRIVSFEVKPDPANENPKNPENDKPKFIPVSVNPEAAPIHIAAEDVDYWSAFVPRHSTYFATYFMITGLHGLHVLAGVLVFCFLWGPGAAMYRTNPEHLANRVEVAGLFWHFVDLVWIFVFPLFYLL